MQFKILYTSDVHGQITATNYATNRKENFGLTRLAKYLETLQEEYLLLDNGDFLQGNVLLDYYRKFDNQDIHPMIKAFNKLSYDYVNLGNHDFNYGHNYQKSVLSELKARVVCANIVDKNSQPIYSPYVIKELKSGHKIGIVGAVTQYIPQWEKPEHINDLSFLDAYDCVAYYTKKIRHQVDYLIVLYHGGFEQDFKTEQKIGRETKENMGYKISTLNAIDLLLCGHQHMPTVHQTKSKTWVMQTAENAKNFGLVDVQFNESGFNHEAKLINNTFNESTKFNELFHNLELKTQNWLDQLIGKTTFDMTITSQLEARKTNHPMFQLINNIQLELTKADISTASLPNDAQGFQETIRLRDVAANFVYPNTIQVLEISGKDLKIALERTAEYFTIKNNKVAIDESFLYPKIEHYNYDIYAGLEYTFNLTKNKGNRLDKALFKNEVIDDHKLYTIALNNYRAQGGGDYPMYANARLIKEYTDSMFDLVVAYIKNNPNLEFEFPHNFKLIF